MTSNAPFISNPADERVANVGTSSMVDVKMVFHAFGENTGNQLELTEIHWGPGQQSRIHVHHRENEGFFLLEGSMTLVIPGVCELEAGAGQFVWSPAGLPHFYRIADDQTARVLVIGVPGWGLGQFFADLADGRAVDISDPEKLAEYNRWALAEYGIEFMDEATAIDRTTTILARHPEMRPSL